MASPVRDNRAVREGTKTVVDDFTDMDLVSMRSMPDDDVRQGPQEVFPGTAPRRKRTDHDRRVRRRKRMAMFLQGILAFPDDMLDEYEREGIEPSEVIAGFFDETIPSSAAIAFRAKFLVEHQYANLKRLICEEIDDGTFRVGAEIEIGTWEDDAAPDRRDAR